MFDIALVCTKKRRLSSWKSSSRELLRRHFFCREQRQNEVRQKNLSIIALFAKALQVTTGILRCYPLETQAFYLVTGRGNHAREVEEESAILIGKGFFIHVHLLGLRGWDEHLYLYEISKNETTQTPQLLKGSLILSSILAFLSFLALRTGCTFCQNHSCHISSVHFFLYGETTLGWHLPKKGLRRNKGRMREGLFSWVVNAKKDGRFPSHPFCILPRACCEEQSPWNRNYLRTSGFTTRPERRQRVHTVRVATRPSGNWWRTRCRLGLKRRLVLILEWLTRLPTCGVFPQKAQHLLMIILQKQECSSWVGAEPLSDLCLVTHAQKYLFNVSSDARNCKLKSLFSPKKVTNNYRFVGPLLCACTLFVPFGLRLTTRRRFDVLFAAYHRSGQKIRFRILMRMLGPEGAGTRKHVE